MNTMDFSSKITKNSRYNDVGKVLTWKTKAGHMGGSVG